MNRKKIQAKYKWNLSHIIESDGEWERLFKYVSDNADLLAQYDGKLDNADSLLECLQLSDKISDIVERVYVYAHMKKDEDASNDKYVAMSDRSSGLAVKLSSSASFIMPQLSRLSNEVLSNFAKLLQFVDYDYMLAEIIREKAHILSDAEEKLLSLSSRATGNYRDIFGMLDNLELPFPKVLDERGKKVQLTHGTYSKHLQSRDVAVRKSAFDGMYKTFKSYINTISAVYDGSVKKDVFYSTVRKYHNCLTRALKGDDIPSAVYDKLIDAVSSRLSVLHRYVGYRKQALGLGELHMYDMHTPIVDGADIKMEYDDAYDLVVESLAPMGTEYAKLLKEAKDGGWIDVYETKGKRSGAYSWGTYSAHPYVLLNYQQTTHDIFTIAHEMGHALHSYYSNKFQPYSKAGYKIFVAEVASTVNEVLLLKYLMRTTTDKAVKKYLLSYYLDMFRTTLFRQTMFSEFEKFSHELIERDEAISQKVLSDYYYDLNKKYYGKDVIHDDLIRYEWARIPHFYNSFYVYKYATGLTAAVSIASRILSDSSYLPKYFGFLKAGGSKSPYQILKDADIDLATAKPYDDAMGEFESTLAELERL
ncbi:MAG: oligoendopeptidase F [Firmicutes bacterium]|nr:oligoendopeptidase F [Bacillota bacterium]